MLSEIWLILFNIVKFSHKYDLSSPLWLKMLCGVCRPCSHPLMSWSHTSVTAKNNKDNKHWSAVISVCQLCFLMVYTKNVIAGSYGNSIFSLGGPTMLISAVPTPNCILPTVHEGFWWSSKSRSKFIAIHSLHASLSDWHEKDTLEFLTYTPRTAKMLGFFMFIWDLSFFLNLLGFSFGVLCM